MKNDNNYSGFLVALEPARSKRIWNSIENGDVFQDSFSVDDWELSRKEIFFLTLKKRGREIDAVILVERAHGAGGTGKPKYSFDKPIIISPPISSVDVSDLVQDFKSLVSTPSRGIRIEYNLWKSLVRRIKQLRPAISDELDALLLLVERTASMLGGEGKLDRLAEQRDGLGLCLDVAGIPRSEILKSIHEDRVETSNSILDLFDDLPLHERHIIEHDRSILEQIFEGGVVGASFQGDGVNKVRVYVADKTALETALGTDLIIYQSLWNSLVFIQYKLMSNKDDAADGWVYRPDGQFDKQVECIEGIMHDYPASVAINVWDFRTCDNPFYFKFCEKRRPSGRDDSLVRGLNISWPILSKFLKMDISRGPNDGRIIGYKNCVRYFNNSEFSDFVKSGWLGSSAEGTKYMFQKMKEARLSGREPMLAIVDVPKLSTAELRKASKARRSSKTTKVQVTKNSK